MWRICSCTDVTLRCQLLRSSKSVFQMIWLYPNISALDFWRCLRICENLKFVQNCARLLSQLKIVAHSASLARVHRLHPGDGGAGGCVQQIQQMTDCMLHGCAVV